MQQVVAIDSLPASALDAARSFYADHLATVMQTLDQGKDGLVIALPNASRDHDDWRRALARDLARGHAPIRVNVIGADPGQRRDVLFRYLSTAPGITGQYLAAHDTAA